MILIRYTIALSVILLFITPSTIHAGGSLDKTSPQIVCSYDVCLCNDVYFYITYYCLDIVICAYCLGIVSFFLVFYLCSYVVYILTIFSSYYLHIFRLRKQRQKMILIMMMTSNQQQKMMEITIIQPLQHPHQQLMNLIQMMRV